MRKLQEPGNTKVREAFIPNSQSKTQPSLPPEGQTSLPVFAPYPSNPPGQGGSTRKSFSSGGTEGGQGEQLKSKIEMREPNTDLVAVGYAVALLGHYGFELRGYTAQELVNLWLKTYPANWIRLAVIEALYQGRYKAVSVEQILAGWFRRGQPFYRFNGEFERLISRKLPQNLTAPFGAVSTDLLQDYNLPLLPPSSEDTAQEQAILEDWTNEPTPTAAQDSSSPDTSVFEYLSETSLLPDDELPKTLINPSSSATYEANWSRCETTKQPIHQFTPQPDSSDFYLKLKAVVQKQEEIPPKIVHEGELEPPCSGDEEE